MIFSFILTFKLPPYEESKQMLKIDIITCSGSAVPLTLLHSSCMIIIDCFNPWSQFHLNILHLEFKQNLFASA